MTARPIVPESRRRPVYAAVALMLVMVAVIVSGCASINEAGNRSDIITPNQTKVPLTPITYVITTLPTIQPQCPVKENTTPWITVNYTDNLQIGDLIKINGTTNIEKGELSIFLLEVAGHTCLPLGYDREGPCPCCKGLTVTAPIISEVGGNNTWSTEVNTSQYEFYPTELYMAIYDLDCRELEHYLVTINITAVSSPQYNSSEQQK
jgi:hypothetical protein